MQSSHGEITRLLADLKNGNSEAVDRLMPLVYADLRKMARRYLRGERVDHTLQPTALVHEAYMRLVDQREANWQNRAHFLAVAAQVMRRILVDHARAHKAEKRGGLNPKLALDVVTAVQEQRYPELIILDDALTNLQKHDSRQGQVVELRFFGGLSEVEIAEVLGISERTVKRDWKIARAWLYREMTR